MVFLLSAGTAVADTSSAAAEKASPWRRVLLLEDYNTRVVVGGVAMLGAAAGAIGSFTLLRKRALMGDALAHASLPGIAVAFITAAGLGGEGKTLPLLLAGATVSGLLGVAVVVVLRRHTRIKEDAAMGIVLSVFFGVGMALLGVIQQMETGSAAGLESFIYGKTASMTAADAGRIAGASAVVLAGCVLLFKEFELLCFDADFAAARGLPVATLDIALMALVVLVTIVGLQAVGLILVVALMIIPAAAARFWTEDLVRMTGLSAAIGLSGGVVGAILSALFPKLPSGAMIVLVCAGGFLISMVCGSSRGVIVRALRRRALNRRVSRQHLLRAAFEIEERAAAADAEIPRAGLLDRRSWGRGELDRTIGRAEDEGLLALRGGAIRLTAAGRAEAARLTRQHRLWELYLIHYADVATARVDREADAIEHVLEPETVARLERLLEEPPVTIPVPADPHAGGRT